MHSSQMKAVGPAISFRTSAWALLQNQQRRAGSSRFLIRVLIISLLSLGLLCSQCEAQIFRDCKGLETGAADFHPRSQARAICAPQIVSLRWPCSGSAVYIRGNTAASIGLPPSPKPRSILLCLDLRIEERFTFAADRMYYDVRSYDPRVFTEPWTAHIEFRKRAEPVDEPWETARYEGERSTQHILGGKAPAK